MHSMTTRSRSFSTNFKVKNVRPVGTPTKRTSINRPEILAVMRKSFGKTNPSIPPADSIVSRASLSAECHESPNLDKPRKTLSSLSRSKTVFVNFASSCNAPDECNEIFMKCNEVFDETIQQYVEKITKLENYVDDLKTSLKEMRKMCQSQISSEMPHAQVNPIFNTVSSSEPSSVPVVQLSLPTDPTTNNLKENMNTVKVTQTKPGSLNVQLQENPVSLDFEAQHNVNTRKNSISSGDKPSNNRKKWGHALVRNVRLTYVYLTSSQPWTTAKALENYVRYATKCGLVECHQLRGGIQPSFSLCAPSAVCRRLFFANLLPNGVKCRPFHP